MTQRTRHSEELETNLGNTKKAGGVFVPNVDPSSARKETPDERRIIIDKVEANVPWMTRYSFPPEA